MLLDGVEVSQVVCNRKHFLNGALCKGTLLCWNRKGSNTNCWNKVGNMLLFEISLYALWFPFIGTKGPRRNLKKKKQMKNCIGQQPQKFGRIVYHLGGQTQCSCCRAPLYLPLCLRPNNGNHQTPHSCGWRFLKVAGFSSAELMKVTWLAPPTEASAAWGALQMEKMTENSF